MHGPLLLLLIGSYAGRLASTRQKPTAASQPSVRTMLLPSLGAVLQVHLKAHSDAKEKADPSCRHVTSAAAAAVPRTHKTDVSAATSNSSSQTTAAFPGHIGVANIQPNR